MALVRDFLVRLATLEGRRAQITGGGDVIGGLCLMGRGREVLTGDGDVAADGDEVHAPLGTEEMGVSLGGKGWC